MNTSWKPRFFIIWSGQALSRFGSEVVSFGLIWWLTDTTRSEAALATGTLMTILPPVLLGPLVGALVDRWSRRAIMAVSDSVIALFSALLAFLYWQGLTQPWHLWGIMLVRAIGGTFHAPSMTASTALMVPREHLSRVGGMNQVLAGVLRIGAPPLGALLVEVLPMHLIAGLDVLTAAFAVVPLLFVSIPRPDAAPAPRRPWGLLREAADGLRYVAANRLLLFVVLSCTVTNVFVGPTWAFNPLLVRNVFGGGAPELALSSSLSGLGLILGGLLMTAWRGFRNRLVTSGVGWMGVGLAAAAVVVIPDGAFYAFVASRFAAAFLVPVGSAPLDAWYQSHVAPDKQGRVFAVLNSLDQLTMPVGLAIGGAVGDAVPLRFWYGVMGIQHALLGLSWLLLPFVRRAEDLGGRPPAAIS